MFGRLVQGVIELVCGSSYEIVKAGTPAPSKGEQLVMQALNELRIAYEREFIIDDERIRHKRFDFHFEKDGRHFLIEYDGEPHFKYVKYIHKAPEYFTDYQATDRLKQTVALGLKYHVIRIDFTVRNVNHIKGFIETALEFKRPRVTYSDKTLYEHLQ
jgi:hypothetical protein